MKTLLKQQIKKLKLKNYFKNNFNFKNYFPKIAAFAAPIFLGVVAIAFATSVGTNITTTGNHTVGGDLTVDRTFGMIGDSGVSYTTNAMLEVWGSHSGASNTMNMLLENELTGSGGSVSEAKNARFRLKFKNDTVGVAQTYTSSINSLAFTLAFQNAGNYILNTLKGLSVVMVDGSDAFGSTTTVTDWINFHTTDSQLGGNGTYNIIRFYQIYLEDWNDAFSLGTIGTSAGMWIEKQTTGDTNNYGLVLDGNGSGANIVFGASQEKDINYDGSDMQYGGMPLNDLGSKQVCFSWASVVDPSICLSYLTPATTETDLVGNHIFSYKNTATSEVDVKSQVYKLNGTLGNEYLCYDSNFDGNCDNNSIFSYTVNDSTDTSFSGAVWMEVTNPGTQQVVMSKFILEGNREWELSLTASRTAQLQLTDISVPTDCIPATTGALSEGWHLLGFSYDGTAQSNGQASVKFYDNGQLMASNSDACSGYMAMEDTTTPLYIWSRSNATLNFKGDGGHVMIVPAVITANQHLKLYNNSKMFYGL